MTTVDGTCPYCGGDHFVSAATKTVDAMADIYLNKCRGCGKWSRGNAGAQEALDDPDAEPKA